MPQSEQAATTSTLALVRSMSGSMGISIAGAIFNARAKSLTAGIQGYTTPQNPSADLRGLVNIQPPSLSREVIHEYGQALNLVWVVLAPIVGVGFLCSLPVKAYSFNRQKRTAKDQEPAEDVTPIEHDAPVEEKHAEKIQDGRQAEPDQEGLTESAQKAAATGASTTQPASSAVTTVQTDRVSHEQRANGRSFDVERDATASTTVPTPTETTSQDRL